MAFPVSGQMMAIYIRNDGIGMELLLSNDDLQFCSGLGVAAFCFKM